MPIARPLPSLVLCLATFAWAAGARAEDTFTDDFRSEVPGRWETVVGSPWKIDGGRLVKVPASGEYEKGAAVCDFPMAEGEVEAVILPDPTRAASVGLVAKFISPKKCLHLRIAYWHASVLASCPGDAFVTIGPYLLTDPEDRSKPTEPVHLRMVIRDGRVAVYINGVLRTLLKDPFPGEAGRPGVYSESSSYVTSFKARRTR